MTIREAIDTLIKIETQVGGDVELKCYGDDYNESPILTDVTLIEYLEGNGWVLVS